jgi:hypothetical protein
MATSNNRKPYPSDPNGNDRAERTLSAAENIGCIGM